MGNCNASEKRNENATEEPRQVLSTVSDAKTLLGMATQLAAATTVDEYKQIMHTLLYIKEPHISFVTSLLSNQDCAEQHVGEMKRGGGAKISKDYKRDRLLIDGHLVSATTEDDAGVSLNQPELAKKMAGLKRVHCILSDELQRAAFVNICKDLSSDMHGITEWESKLCEFVLFVDAYQACDNPEDMSLDVLRTLYYDSQGRALVEVLYGGAGYPFVPYGRIPVAKLEGLRSVALMHLSEAALTRYLEA